MPQATDLIATRRVELPLADRLMALRNFTRVEPGEGEAAKAPLATATLAFSTGAGVERYDWVRERAYNEVLVVEEGAIRMGRLAAGAPLLNTHDSYDLDSVLGVVINPRIADGVGECDVSFSRRNSVAGYVQDVADGVIRNASVGYVRHRVQMVEPDEDGGMWTYRVIDWEPYEVSLVPIPADAGAQVRSDGHAASGETHVRTFPCDFETITPRAAALSSKAKTMTEAELQAQREQEAATRATAEAAQRAQAEAAANAAIHGAMQRAAEITEVCARHGVAQLASAMIRDNKTPDQARAAVLDEIAKRDGASGGHRNIGGGNYGVGSEHETRMAGIEEAVLSRVDPATKVGDNGRHYRGLSLLEMGREVLEARGISTRGLPRMELAGLMVRTPGMHTTSDFANIFGNVARKRLRAAYAQSMSTYDLWARRAPNLPDFKPTRIIALSGAPELLKVNEHGEFKYGTMTDGAETFKLLTYGRIVAITREAIVNDDLRAFDRLVSAFGDSASRLENRLVYAELTDNAVLSDGVALFHATHGNLGTGAGSALSLDSLSAARAAMRKQKGISGEQLNTIPRFLIVPAALEGLAYQLTSNNYQPTTQGGINEFAAGGRTALTVIVEPLLDAISTTAWYLATDAGSVDTVEYAFLDGEEGPVIETEVGFEVDGTSWKCREDFAAKATDWRGLYKSNGA